MEESMKEMEEFMEEIDKKLNELIENQRKMFEHLQIKDDKFQEMTEPLTNMNIQMESMEKSQQDYLKGNEMFDEMPHSVLRVLEGLDLNQQPDDFEYCLEIDIGDENDIQNVSDYSSIEMKGNGSESVHFGVIRNEFYQDNANDNVKKQPDWCYRIPIPISRSLNYSKDVDYGGQFMVLDAEEYEKLRRALARFNIEGYVTGFGNLDWSRIHESATRTCPVVAALVDGGATCIGKTVVDARALSISGENKHYGTPTNPAATARIPGGVSSGTVVVVAAKRVEFFLGIDIDGGVRVPIGYCGVLEFRPSYGTVSLSGVIPVSTSLDTVEWFSKDPSVLRRVGHVLLPRPYAAHVTDRLSAVANPMGGQCRDVKATTNSNQERALTEYSEFGTPLMNQHQSSSIGITVRKSYMAASLAQFISGVELNSNGIARSFSTFGQIVWKISRNTKLSLLGVYEESKLSSQSVNLGALALPLGIPRDNRFSETSVEEDGNLATSTRGVLDGTTGLMFESEFGKGKRLGGWIETKNSNPRYLQWSVSTSGSQLDCSSISYQTSLFIRSLGAPEIKKMPMFLQDIFLNADILGQYSDSNSDVSDVCLTMDKTVLSEAASYLVLSAHFVPFCNPLSSCDNGGFNASTSPNPSYADGATLDSNVLLSWIFTASSSAKELAVRKGVREDRTKRGLEILQLLQEEFYQVRDPCTRKDEHMTCHKALMEIERLFLQEVTKGKQVANSIPRTQSHMTVLMTRQQELNKISKETTISSELNAITDVLKQAKSLSDQKDYFDETYCVVSKDHNWRTKACFKGDFCIELSLWRKIIEVCTKLNRMDTRIMQMRIISENVKWSNKFDAAFFRDFRPVLIPLVKFFLRAFLEDLAVKEAKKESDVSKEALLTEFSLDSKKDKKKKRNGQKKYLEIINDGITHDQTTDEIGVDADPVTMLPKEIEVNPLKFGRIRQSPPHFYEFKSNSTQREKKGWDAGAWKWELMVVHFIII